MLAASVFIMILLTRFSSLCFLLTWTFRWCGVVKTSGQNWHWTFLLQTWTALMWSKTVWREDSSFEQTAQATFPLSALTMMKFLSWESSRWARFGIPENGKKGSTWSLISMETRRKKGQETIFQQAQWERIEKHFPPNPQIWSHLFYLLRIHIWLQQMLEPKNLTLHFHRNRQPRSNDNRKSQKWKRNINWIN